MKPTDSPRPPDHRGHGAASRGPTRFDDGVAHHHWGDHDELHNEDVAHEHSDINVRAILTSAVILIVVAAVSHVIIWLLFGWLERGAMAVDMEVSPLAPAATEMPANTVATPEFAVGATGPQLLTNEPMALERHYADQRTRLQGYGWVDQGAGVARIPIDEAKRLILERGLPVREGAEAPAFGVLPPSRGEASGGRAITTELPEPPARGTAPAPEPHGQGGH